MQSEGELQRKGFYVLVLIDIPHPLDMGVRVVSKEAPSVAGKNLGKRVKK